MRCTGLRPGGRLARILGKASGTKARVHSSDGAPGNFVAMAQTPRGEIAKWRRPKDSMPSTCIALICILINLNCCDLGSFDSTSASSLQFRDPKQRHGVSLFVTKVLMPLAKVWHAATLPRLSGKSEGSHLRSALVSTCC